MTALERKASQEPSVTASQLGAVASLAKSQGSELRSRADDPSQTQPRDALARSMVLRKGEAELGSSSQGSSSGPDRGRFGTVPRPVVAQLWHQR